MVSHKEFLQQLEDGENGHFTLDNRDGRALLRVYPPGANGRRVTSRDVEARLTLFGIRDLVRALLEETIHRADGEAVDIGYWPVPDPVPAKITVDLADDRMSAELTLSPPLHGGAWPDREELLAALNQAGVVAGYLENILTDLAETPMRIERQREQERDQVEEREPQSGIDGPQWQRKTAWHREEQRQVVARGQLPRPGTDASIRYYFNPRPQPRPRLQRSDGSELMRVDFKELQVIQHCQAGDLLADIVEAVDGSPGFDVCGNPLAVEPSLRVALTAGRGTKMSQDRTRLLAELTGHVRIFDDPAHGSARIDIDEILTLDNVDYSTGHIDFPGTVVVTKDVYDGFRIHADGDIIVQKSLSNVYLKAKGDIILSGGIVSRGEGMIQAGGSVYARFVESSTVQAGRDIIIEEAAMHSRLTAGHVIVIESGRGELIGGTTLAAREIRVRKLGARVEVATRVYVGLDPETMEKLRRIEEDYEEKRSTVKKVNLHLQQLDELQRRGKTLEPDQELTRQKLAKIRDSYTTFMHNLADQREKIYDTVTPDPEAQIEVLEEVYPGVEISMGAGTHNYRIEQRSIRDYSRFKLEGSSILCVHSPYL